MPLRAEFLTLVLCGEVSGDTDINHLRVSFTGTPILTVKYLYTSGFANDQDVRMSELTPILIFSENLKSKQ